MKKPQNKTVRKFDACVVGGAGHVGAPLAIVLAKKGLRTLIYDFNKATMATLSKGKMPFLEEGGEQELKQVLKENMLGFTNKVSDIQGIPYVIITIGTPLDEFHNPDLAVLTDCIDGLMPYLSNDQTLILRSTVFPGATDFLHKYLAKRGKKTKIAFCPERVVQGFAIKEIQTLVQMVSGTTPAAEESAAQLFEKISGKIVRMKAMEAEFAKLFCNTYRYTQFAIANQFYMMAAEAGLDYGNIREKLMQDYPRMRDLPGAGFAAGPCLFKDTLQLVAHSDHKFELGVSAVQTNEGMPAHVVSHLRKKHELGKMVVGILGMAFKANSDDGRSSLSYKLKRLLSIHAKKVLTTDPHVEGDEDLMPIEKVIKESDILVFGTPHAAYKDLDLKDKLVYDIWDFYKK